MNSLSTQSNAGILTIHSKLGSTSLLIPGVVYQLAAQVNASTAGTLTQNYAGTTASGLTAIRT